jgi:hypothetical protein
MSAPQPPTLPRVIGHRGAAGHAPENTLASIGKAAALSAACSIWAATSPRRRLRRAPGPPEPATSCHSPSPSGRPSGAARR